MKAIRFHRYGEPSVLRWEEVADPRPRRSEVRVRVHAAALNPKDVLIRKGKMRALDGGLPRPSGQDLAGVVDAVGPGVRALRVGEEVFGMIPGMGAGACAELALLPSWAGALKPRSASMVEAAAVPLAGMTALQALRGLARVRPGDEVLLNGASGGVGTFAIQIAKILGGRVTAVTSARNASFARGLGADEVMPYDREPLLESDRLFDVIFDIFGSAPYELGRRLLRDGGRHVTTIPRPRSLLREAASRVGLGRARLVLVRAMARDLSLLAQWIDAGTLRPIVDRVLPIARAADAHVYLETRRARGKVVLEVAAA